MALPALHALAGLGSLVIHAPRWGTDLYRDVPAEVRERGTAGPADVAVLFGPSWRAALRARRATRRVGHVGEPGRRLLLTDVVPEGAHRSDGYRALADRLGAVVSGPPRWGGRAGDPASDLPVGHIGLNAVSVSGDVVQWRRFGALATRLDRPVVFYGGPGEEAAVAAIAGEHPRAVGLTLPAFASALARCAVFVSNDSGAAHFARACGVPTVVVYGSTSPERTGPDGAVAVLGPRVACAPCYRKSCSYALECLDVPVDSVLNAIRNLL